MRTPSLVASITAVLVAAAQAGAQTTTNLNTATTDTPISIVLAPNPPMSMHAIISTVGAGKQFVYDVSNPAVPKTVGTGLAATASQDQFTRSWYSPAFSGLLFTAHRNGGLRMWDADVAKLMAVAVPQLTSVPTTYSHEGLKTFTDSLSRTWVMYSEQHTGATSLGGLRVYQAGAATLTARGDALVAGSAGNALEISNDGRYVWQLGDQGNVASKAILRVYDTANKSVGAGSITELAPVPLPPYVNSNADRYLEKNATQSTLVGTLGFDGIQPFGITNPVNPVPKLPFQFKPWLHVRGVTFLENTNFALIFGYLQIGAVFTDFMWFIQTDTAGPGSFSFVGNPINTPGFYITDAKISAPRIYLVGKLRASGQPQMRIY